MWLFLPFLLIPLVEITLFIQVGGWIGLWPTLGLVLLMAVVGTALVRAQGMQTLAELERSLAGGTDPANPIAHGALIIVAGFLLLTPGFFTDIMAVALLLRPVRTHLIRWGASRVTVRAASFARRSGAQPPPRPTQPTEPIEVDYEVLDEPRAEPGSGPPRRGQSGWTRRDE